MQKATKIKGKILNNKRFNKNEQIAHKEILVYSANITELKNRGKFSYKTKCKWEKQG
jgi:hypothetical protein